MTCEICSEEFDDLYNADGIAELFGEVPYYDDEEYLICSHCLNKIKDALGIAWSDSRRSEEQK